jgi:hypothetical protein
LQPLKHRADLTLAEAAADVLRAVHVPRGDGERDRPRRDPFRCWTAFTAGALKATSLG